MRKFLFDMRKDFLIMSNFYLVEILSEPNSLTIVTSKKNTQNEQLCAHFVYFFPHNENQEFAVLLQSTMFTGPATPGGQEAINDLLPQQSASVLLNLFMNCTSNVA